MFKKTLLSALVAVAMIGSASLSTVYADDTDDRKFDDPDRLETTLAGWQDELSEEKTSAAEQDLADAQVELELAKDSGNAEDIAAAQEAVDKAQANLDGIALEQEKIAALIAGEPVLDENGDPIVGADGEPLTLTEEQIFALNRSLNNATNNGLIVDLDSEYLERLIAGEYSKQQINSLTKALEEEAKFGKLSDMFTSKYDATGNEKFLDKADMMSAKGDRQKDKFLAKVDKFGSGDGVNGKDKAKKSARDSAKNSARDASKNSAKNSAKKTAKNNAKKVAKEKARDNAKNKAKSNNGKKNS